jgi:hypothetical protein
VSSTDCALYFPDFAGSFFSEAAAIFKIEPSMAAWDVASSE